MSKGTSECLLSITESVSSDKWIPSLAIYPLYSGGPQKPQEGVQLSLPTALMKDTGTEMSVTGLFSPPGKPG